MKAVLSRTYTPTATMGQFIAFDGEATALKLKTIELPWNNNQKGVSCIPEGVYIVRKIKRPDGRLAFHVQNVEGRSAILFHPGNFVHGKKVDSEGCIMPGMYFQDINGDGNMDVAESTKAMNLMLDTMPDEFPLHII